MLTDTAIKNAHRGDKAKLGKAFKLADEKGLFLLVKPGVKGWAKWWRFKFRYGGNEKGLSFGTYPDVTLEQARQRRDDARKLLADDIDPGENRKAVKQAKSESAANSLEVITREWIAKKSQDKSDRPLRLLNHLLPYIGTQPIDTVRPKDILACLRRVEDRGTIETAHRTLQVTSQVFRYAVATGRVERDITADLRGALQIPKSSHFAAITDPSQVVGLLRAIDGYSGTFPVLCALRLAPLVFVRPGELRAAEWQHFDIGAKEWRYLVGKTQTQHIVPLSSQAIEILKELQPLTGDGVWLFPSERNPRNIREGRSMSENTVNAALKRLGYGKDVMTGHGFRAMARTILDEVLQFRPDFIEHQLAHSVRDPNGRAYNRTAHLPERHKMMQCWADYLDSLKAGGNVILIGVKRQG
jgi:integrase